MRAEALRPAAGDALRRAACLAAVMLSAKGVLVALRAADGATVGAWSGWTPLAYGYQDMLVAALFGLAAFSLLAATSPAGRARHAVGAGLWLGYAVLGAVVAVNVPIARLLGTPATMPLLAGASGELADSIRPYVTPANVLSALLVLAAAAAVPVLARRSGPAPGRLRPAVLGAGALALVLVLGLGPSAEARANSIGLHRNAVLALLTTGLAELAEPPAGAAAAPPAALPVEGEAIDLRHLSGVAAGRSVVWIMLESTGARYLAPYGAAADPMPNVTALAASGLVFDHAYTVYPESIKALFAALCASEPAAFTAASRYREGVRPCASLATVLSGAGYRTALFHSGRFVYLGMADVLAGRGFQELYDAGDVGGQFASSFGVDEPATVRRMLQVVDSARPGEPFFLMYLPIAGHHPYESPGDGPRPFGEADGFHRYLSDLAMGDAALGTLIQGLRERGLDDRILWVISGDHGQAFFQHEGNFAHSLYIYEENVQIPLILAIPGALDAPIHVPQLASTIDVAPTVLDLLGMARPASSQGRSLLAPKPGIARFFTDHTLWQVGLRQGRWKLIHEMGTGRTMLFDLSSDPNERLNLAAAEPQRTARYREHLRQWAIAQRRWVVAGH